MGLIAVPPGEVATIVTTLEMTKRPLPAPIPGSPLRLVRWPAPRRNWARPVNPEKGAERGLSVAPQRVSESLTPPNPCWLDELISILTLVYARSVLSRVG